MSNLPDLCARVEHLVSRKESGDILLVSDGNRLLADLKGASKAADRGKRAQIERLQRTVTDFLKQIKQPKASAVSSSKVLSGSGGFGLNLEDQAGTQQETVMPQCAAEGFEVEYKLAEQSTKAAELHEMQQDIRALDGCFRDLGTLLAQQGDVIDSIEEDVEQTATRIPKGTTELAAAGKAKAGKRVVEGAVVSGVVGAVVGIVGGPAGVVVGGAAGAGLGGYVGHALGKSEKKEIERGLQRLGRT